LTTTKGSIQTEKSSTHKWPSSIILIIV